jgi:hypothetical protein
LWLNATVPRAIVSRDRRIGRGGKFGEITDKKHRLPAEVFVERLPPDGLATFQSPKTGAALVYLAREDEPSYGEPKTGSPPVGDPVGAEYGTVALMDQPAISTDAAVHDEATDSTF